MEITYNNSGLSPEQIMSMNDLTKSYSETSGHWGIASEGRAIAEIDQYNAGFRELMKNLGVDLEDPRIHYAVVAGASAMANMITSTPKDPESITLAASMVMNAAVSCRPIEES